MTDAPGRDRKVWVAGHTGLVGSAVVRRLAALGHGRVVVATRAELDLRDRVAVRAFVRAERPEVVVMCAGTVGGIVANSTYPADFIHDNLAMELAVVAEAQAAGVRDLMLLGSSCIYPRDCPQPIREEYLLTGPLEPTNRPYAVAKIAGAELCWALNRQHGTRYVVPMPCNLYGPSDHYDLEKSHVLPALIRRMHEARERGDAAVTLWGTGRPRRELLHVDDLARACVMLLDLPPEAHPTVFPAGAAPVINIGAGTDQTIRELAELTARVVGFRGRLDWDTSRPDGTPQKLLETSRMRALGWRPEIPLAEGIAGAYRDMLARYH